MAAAGPLSFAALLADGRCPVVRAHHGMRTRPPCAVRARGAESALLSARLAVESRADADVEPLSVELEQPRLDPQREQGVRLVPGKRGLLSVWAAAFLQRSRWEYRTVTPRVLPRPTPRELS